MSKDELQALLNLLQEYEDGYYTSDRSYRDGVKKGLKTARKLLERWYEREHPDGST